MPFDLPNSTTLSIAESAFAEPKFESEEHRKLYQEQKKRIQEALNKETYHQFKAYAQHTLPGEPEKVSFDLLLFFIKQFLFFKYLNSII